MSQALIQYDTIESKHRHTHMHTNINKARGTGVEHIPSFLGKNGVSRPFLSSFRLKDTSAPGGGICLGREASGAPWSQPHG